MIQVKNGTLCIKVVPYTSGKIWSARLIFLFFWQCVKIYPLINIKILANSNQQTQSYKFTSHIAAFLSVVLITEMLEICIQTSYDQNVQLILSPCSVSAHFVLSNNHSLTITISETRGYIIPFSEFHLCYMSDILNKLLPSHVNEVVLSFHIDW